MPDLWGNMDEEELYQQALAVPLDEKIEMAFDLINIFNNQAQSINNEGWYVNFSGGKDSIVLADIYKQSFKCNQNIKYQLHTSHTTLDAPQMIYFMKKYYPDLIVHSQPESMLNYMVSHGKGLPSRMGRWCCSLYKENGGIGYFNAVGVRAAESARRKGLWRQVMTDTRTKKQLLAPILYWTDEDVWAYIKSNNLPYPELYDEPYSFKRCGCLGCPLGGKNRAKEFALFPQYEKMWKKATERFFNKWVNIPRRSDGLERSIAKYKNWEEYWEWWMETESVEDTDQPDCQLYLW